MTNVLDTDDYSRRLRERSIRIPERQVLIARLEGSEQAKDLKEPVNCSGFGRIRHFRRRSETGWSDNPLPIEPACAALGLLPGEELRSQVFQTAACNWRCWFCYVDFNRLSASERYGRFLTVDELLDEFVKLPNRPHMIDLSGGQPELTPEWVPWFMEAFEARGLSQNVFLWSDDNLSNYYFWEKLTAAQRAYVARFPKYARVACFKGYTADSFSFNTAAAPELFDRQFDVFQRLLAEGLDLYAYVVFTGAPDSLLRDNMARFVDRLQNIHGNLPLRTVPLKITSSFTPVVGRLRVHHQKSDEFQYKVHDAWLAELGQRFSAEQRQQPIVSVGLDNR